MFSNLDITSLLEPKTLFTFLLGFLIIVLFSKDKFNVPTHDRVLLGPFAQLPPHSLTIDSRYKWGLFVYLSLLTAIYTAISIVGAMTSSNFDFVGFIQGAGLNPAALNAPAAGAKPSNSEIWPVVAATILISTGTAGDSVLGRLELYIRQYAHKSAYIPAAASDLAFNLRSVPIEPWLIANPFIKASEFDERRNELVRLIGEEAADAYRANPDREAEIAAWIRSNILFYALQQVFNKNLHNSRLDELADGEDGKAAYERLVEVHADLLARFTAPTSAGDQTNREVQKFARDTSLTIAVLLLQAARSPNDLNSILNAAGFSPLDSHDQSDRYGYLWFVILTIGAGGLLSGIVLIIPPLFRLWSINWMPSELYQGGIAILNGVLLYVIIFRVLDYSRDRAIESQNWSESFGSYMRMTISGSLLATAISIVLIVLLLSPINGVKYVIYSPAAFAWLVMFQLMLAALGIMFGLLHLRHAARSPRSGLGMLLSSVGGLAIIHACLAALLVCVIDRFVFVQTTGSNIRGIHDVVQQDFQTLVAAPSKKDETPLFWEYTPANRNIIKAELAVVRAAWDQERYGDAEVRKQLAALSAICNVLNGRPASRMLSSGAGPEAGGLVADDVRLFKNPNECQPSIPDDRVLKTSSDDQVTIFSRFVNSLGLLYSNIQTVGTGQESIKANYLAWMFPTLVTFLLAYAFGVGIRLARIQWLYGEVDHADGHGERFASLIRSALGGRLSMDKCLVLPISVLNHVTPLEALRYEDLRTRLFGKMEDNQISWIGCEAAQALARSDGLPRSAF